MKNKGGLIGTLILLGIILIAGFFWFVGVIDERGTNKEDIINCVPATCCHSTECVPESEAPNCEDIFCSMECTPGTLDCGQATCEYIDGKCEVVSNE